MKTNAPNINYLWSQLIVEELARSGVGLIAIAPGSRSSPLAVAAVRNRKVRTVVHVDERGLGFFALGWARARGTPAVVITTSGTAVANLAPAFAEASNDHVPLLALTADRPPELRETGANQTMRQADALAPWARWRFDLPPPSDELPARSILTTVDHAVAMTRRAPAGPVHMNIMLREPLAPHDLPFDRRAALAGLDRWLRGSRPYTIVHQPAPRVSGAAIREAVDLLTRSRRGVVLAGAMSSEEAAAAVAVAKHLGWPLLPDIRSGLRVGGAESVVVSHTELLLASPRFAGRGGCDAVLHLGGRIVSRRLNEYTQADGIRYVHVSAAPERLDPAHRVGLRCEGDVADFCARLARALPRPRRPEAWLRTWLAANRRGAAALRDAMAGDRWDEPSAVWEVARALAAGHALFLGNSLPIRLAEAFAPARREGVAIFANRGVSGIDGVLASAVGCAMGTGRPLTLVLGDISLLHDLNSLALLRAVKVPVTVVVLNNDGGGIFSFLAVADTVPEFERVFGTPHGLTFEAAATMFGLPYDAPEGRDALRSAYRAHERSGASGVIEVRTTRATTGAAFRRLQAVVARAVDAELG